MFVVSGIIFAILGQGLIKLEAWRNWRTPQLISYCWELLGKYGGFVFCAKYFILLKKYTGCRYLGNCYCPSIRKLRKWKFLVVWTMFVVSGVIFAILGQGLIKLEAWRNWRTPQLISYCWELLGKYGGFVFCAKYFILLKKYMGCRYLRNCSLP